MNYEHYLLVADFLSFMGMVLLAFCLLLWLIQKPKKPISYVTSRLLLLLVLVTYVWQIWQAERWKHLAQNATHELQKERQEWGAVASHDKKANKQCMAALELMQETNEMNIQLLAKLRHRSITPKASTQKIANVQAVKQKK